MPLDKILRPNALDFPEIKSRTIEKQSGPNDIIFIRNAKLVLTNVFLIIFQKLINRLESLLVLNSNQ